MGKVIQISLGMVSVSTIEGDRTILVDLIKVTHAHTGNVSGRRDYRI